MSIDEKDAQIAHLEATLQGLLIASRPVSTCLYNIGQSHEQWNSTIYPAIQKYDAWVLRAYKVLKGE